MSNEQNYDRNLRTPIETYSHPEFGNRVDLVGMIHVAQPPYYEAIQEFVDTRQNDGAVVHYEGVRVSEEMQRASKRIAARAIRLSADLDGLYGWFEDSGLVLQKDALDYRESWENHDTTLLEMVERLGPLKTYALRAAVKGAGFLLRTLERTDPAGKQKALSSVLSKQAENTGAGRPAPRFITGSIGNVVLDYRNGIALSAFDSQQELNPETDVVMLWGAGHLTGLGSGLRDRGFTKVDEVKVTAIDLDSL